MRNGRCCAPIRAVLWDRRQVMIWDDFQSKCIGELSFRNEVKAVRLRRDRYAAGMNGLNHRCAQATVAHPQVQKYAQVCTVAGLRALRRPTLRQIRAVRSTAAVCDEPLRLSECSTCCHTTDTAPCDPIGAQRQYRCTTAFCACSIVVVLEYKLYVYNFTDLKLLTQVRTHMSANPQRGAATVRWSAAKPNLKLSCALLRSATRT